MEAELDKWIVELRARISIVSRFACNVKTIQIYKKPNPNELKPSIFNALNRCFSNFRR